MKTKNQALIVNLFLGLVVGLITIGCGTRTKDSGSVSIQFANNTASALQGELRSVGPVRLLNGLDLQSELQGETPLIFQMKLVAFYLVEEIDEMDNNVGDATRIWTSRKCDDDLTLCGIGPAAGQYQVDYFNFAAGTAAVNEAFAGYKRTNKESTLNPGTYNYIRMDFTGATGAQIDVAEPNLMFGRIESHEARGQYGLTVRLPESLVLEEGESFTVNLAYDLENSYYESGHSHVIPTEVGERQWTCSESMVADVPCIVEPEFVPTITKN